MAYQCRVDTDCCGVGPKARNDGAWNKCCVAGNSSGVELDVWVTLAACMGLLVLFVAGECLNLGVHLTPSPFLAVHKQICTECDWDSFRPLHREADDRRAGETGCECD